MRIAEIEHDRKYAGFAAVDLAEIVQAVVELYEPIADDKGLQLNANVEAHAIVHGDRDLLMDAVANLVDNAVKFTSAPGRILVELQTGTGGPTIRVSNGGSGIAAAERDNVLRRFYRWTRAGVRRVSASGSISSPKPSPSNMDLPCRSAMRIPAASLQSSVAALI